MSKCRLALWAVLIPLCLATACSSSDQAFSGSGNSTVRVLLTDAASDYIAAAEVTISSVRLVPGNAETGFVELFDAGASPMTYDLLELQNGINALLAESLVPAGIYTQVRMIVDDATVTLADGYQFNESYSTDTDWVFTRKAR